MADDRRDRARVLAALLLVSAAGWALLVMEGERGLTSAHGAHAAGVLPASALAAGWTLMLIAMMPPALLPPVCHVRLRSFRRRRGRAVALFVTAYAAVWAIVGAGLVAIALAATLFLPHAYLPGVAGLVVALVWQCSPIKQRCLNRCHAHPALAAFGAAADIAVLRFGAAHGFWCVGSCWLLMLCPLLLPGGHLAAMAAATVLILSERLERPRQPGWGVRGLGKATRIVAAQTRMRLVSRARPRLLRA